MGVDEWVGRGLVARAGVGPTQVLHLSTVCSTGKDWEKREKRRVVDERLEKVLNIGDRFDLAPGVLALFLTFAGRKREKECVWQRLIEIVTPVLALRV